MASSYSFTDINMLTADHRLFGQRPTPQTREGRIARLEQWLADRAGSEWTRGYKEAARELEMLKEAN